MWYKNIVGGFFGLVTKHACDGQTDSQNYDSQDRASHSSRGKKPTVSLKALLGMVTLCPEFSRGHTCLYINSYLHFWQRLFRCNTYPAMHSNAMFSLQRLLHHPKKSNYNFLFLGLPLLKIAKKKFISKFLNKPTDNRQTNQGKIWCTCSRYKYKKPSYRWGTARRGRASWNLVKFCTNVDDLYLKSSETRLLPIRL